MIYREILVRSIIMIVIPISANGCKAPYLVITSSLSVASIAAPSPVVLGIEPHIPQANIIQFILNMYLSMKNPTRIAVIAVTKEVNNEVKSVFCK